MKSDITYKFRNATDANRFVNELKHWHKHEVQAKLYKKESIVKVSYDMSGKQFSYVSSDLDELASHYLASEI